MPEPALVEGLVDAIAAHESSLLTYEKDYGVTYRILDERCWRLVWAPLSISTIRAASTLNSPMPTQEMLVDGTMERGVKVL
ncbi:MAG: hypothetical protein ACLTYW_06145 [Collinsella sp.]